MGNRAPLGWLSPPLQPGYLSDLWLVGSLVGRAMDWDGTVLDGWADPPVIAESPQDFAPGLRSPPNANCDWYSWYGSTGGLHHRRRRLPDQLGPLQGGARSVYGATGSAVTVAQARIEPADYPGIGYFVWVGCELRGDLIPSDPKSPNPYVPVQGQYGEWPTAYPPPGC